ncbi:hypothetical protein I312_103870 [Cryptococcus bacillisporus CA1280]|uniref:uncharacterized protein n=1 Tax=Cryptococcus bacillisporus CA1280 TaxID=1296109 RepID=UPI003365C9CD
METRARERWRRGVSKFYGGDGEHCGGYLSPCLAESLRDGSTARTLSNILHIFRLFLLNTYILLPAISSFFSGSVAKTPAFVSIHQLSHTAGTEGKTETRTLAHCPRLNWDSLITVSQSLR